MLLLDKPEGPTSHDVVAAVRRRFRTRRVGHVGTLDPMATGLLIMLLGRLTRLARFLAGLDKRYEGVLRLGQITDTDDRLGTVLEGNDRWHTVTDHALQTAMQGFVGGYTQQPPAYSAKKIEGIRAYRRARRGEPVQLVPHPVSVTAFAMQARAGPDVTFVARVGTGTYVRSLARDLGAALGCGAHLTALRRTHIGEFSVADALPVRQLEGETPSLRPARDVVRHLPAVELGADDARAVRHGRHIAACDGPEGPVALVQGDELIAVAERRADEWAPRVVVS